MSRIVIVDDVLLMRNRIRLILESMDHTVVGEADNGVDAVRLYQLKRPDLLTLDISMPEQDGMATINQILETDPEAKIIIISALEQKKLIMKALARGVKAFIVKPFQPDKVAQKVDEVLQAM